jgi:serine/threonine protein kinase
MTPAYAAPEAMFEKTSSSKSDVFSFAVVMYEMMTLREPYTAEGNHLTVISSRCLYDMT